MEELALIPVTLRKFTASRMEYIAGLKSPSEQQTLLLALFGQLKTKPTKKDHRDFLILLKAEHAEFKAAEAKRNARKLINDGKEKERKARSHELYKVAGLLSLAGLVSKETGKPLLDRGELLGALLEIAELPTNAEKRLIWKQKGDSLLAKIK